MYTYTERHVYNSFTAGTCTQPLSARDMYVYKKHRKDKVYDIFLYLLINDSLRFQEI